MPNRSLRKCAVHGAHSHTPVPSVSVRTAPTPDPTQLRLKPDFTSTWKNNMQGSPGKHAKRKAMRTSGLAGQSHSTQNLQHSNCVVWHVNAQTSALAQEVQDRPEYTTKGHPASLGKDGSFSSQDVEGAPDGTQALTNGPGLPINSIATLKGLETRPKLRTCANNILTANTWPTGQQMCFSQGTGKQFRNHCVDQKRPSKDTHYRQYQMPHLWRRKSKI